MHIPDAVAVLFVTLLLMSGCMVVAAMLAATKSKPVSDAPVRKPLVAANMESKGWRLGDKCSVYKRDIREKARSENIPVFPYRLNISPVYGDWTCTKAEVIGLGDDEFSVSFADGPPRTYRSLEALNYDSSTVRIVNVSRHDRLLQAQQQQQVPDAPAGGELSALVDSLVEDGMSRSEATAAAQSLTQARS